MWNAKINRTYEEVSNMKTQPQTSALLDILDKIESLATVGLWLCTVRWMITEAGGSRVPTVPIALAIIFTLLFVRLKYLAMHDIAYLSSQHSGCKQEDDLQGST